MCQEQPHGGGHLTQGHRFGVASGGQGHRLGWPCRSQAHTPSPAPRRKNAPTTSSSAAVLPGATPLTKLRDPRRRDAPPGPHQAINKPMKPPTTSGSDLPGCRSPPDQGTSAKAAEKVEAMAMIAGSNRAMTVAEAAMTTCH